MGVGVRENKKWGIKQNVYFKNGKDLQQTGAKESRVKTTRELGGHETVCVLVFVNGRSNIHVTEGYDPVSWWKN